MGMYDRKLKALDDLQPFSGKTYFSDIIGVPEEFLNSNAYLNLLSILFDKAPTLFFDIIGEDKFVTFAHLIIKDIAENGLGGGGDHDSDHPCDMGHVWEFNDSCHQNLGDCISQYEADKANFDITSCLRNSCVTAVNDHNGEGFVSREDGGWGDNSDEFCDSYLTALGEYFTNQDDGDHHDDGDDHMARSLRTIQSGFEKEDQEYTFSIRKMFTEFRKNNPVALQGRSSATCQCTGYAYVLKQIEAQKQEEAR